MNIKCELEEKKVGEKLTASLVARSISSPVISKKEMDITVAEEVVSKCAKETLKPKALQKSGNSAFEDMMKAKEHFEATFNF